MTSKTTYKTWTGVALPSSEMNTYVRDNGNYVFERLSHYISLSTADVTITNSLAETNLFSYSVPGNEMTATGLMRLDFRIHCVNNKGTAGTVTFKFYIGANSITLNNAAYTINNAAAGFWVGSLYIRGAGTTSSQDYMLMGSERTNGSSQSMDLRQSTTAEITTATDITTSQTWKLTATMNAASASFTTTGRFAGLTYNLATM